MHTHEYRNSKYKIQMLLMIAAVIITVFSALPVLSNSSTYKTVLLVTWFLTFLINVTLFKINFSATNIIILLSWGLYMMYCLIMYVVYGNGYVNGIYFYPVNLCIFIFLNGCFLSHKRAESIISKLTIVYNVCSAFVVLCIYIKEFLGVQYLESQVYIYGEKNSIGPIIVCNLIILVLRKAERNTMLKVARYASICFFVYVLLLVNNRAGVAELIIVFLCYMVFTKNNRKLPHGILRNKFGFIVICMLCCVLLLITITSLDEIIQKTAGFLNWSLKLDSVYDLNKFSSGRISLYDLTINYVIKLYPLFGAGRWYIDFFYLGVVAELGIIGALPIFTIIFMNMFTAVRNIRSTDQNTKLLVFICIQMMVSTFFEALPPFGPGTVVFMFWLLFGNYAGSKILKKTHQYKSTSKKYF